MADLVRVAGMRWTVEERMQTGKGVGGLDHDAVRSWTGWYRHTTLALWAHAFLSIIRVERGVADVPKKGPSRQIVAQGLARFKAHRGLRSD